MSEDSQPSPPDKDPEDIPLVLNYQAGKAKYQPYTPFGLQVFAGFLTWIGGLVFIVMAANNRRFGAPFVDSQNIIPRAIAAGLIAIGTLAIWLRPRFRWRGFLPGLLLGFGPSCLLPLGIVLIICGMK